jgi:hypothetical protein
LPSTEFLAKDWQKKTGAWRREQVVDPDSGGLNTGMACFLFSFVLVVNWTLLQVNCRIDVYIYTYR